MNVFGREQAVSVGGADDAGAIQLADALEARAEVDGVAEAAVLELVERADVDGQDSPRVQSVLLLTVKHDGLSTNDMTRRCISSIGVGSLLE
jgi:hypothetical protein